MSQVVASLIGYWREQTAALSEATLALFELKAGLSKGVDTTLFAGMSDEASKATKEIENANFAIRSFDKQILFSTGSVGKFMDEVQRAGHVATKSYYEQKLQAEQLEAQILKLGNSTGAAYSGIQNTIDAITRQTHIAIDGFTLLNDQDLDQLRAAMDDANAKLREMQDETQSARDRLSELNAELLEAQGEDEKAELLRQQLDYQQKLADIEQQRQEAELTGNRELLSILSQQEAMLKRINETRVAGIQADAEKARNESRTTTRTTASEPTTSAGTAKKYQLDLTVGSQTLSAQTDTDPQAFLDAITRAKRSSS